MVDTADSKFAGLKTVRVRFPLPLSIFTPKKTFLISSKSSFSKIKNFWGLQLKVNDPVVIIL